LNNDIKNLISLIKINPLKLSVIIVSFNVKYFLEQCLHSVVRACKNIDAEIIVIDNKSTDGSKDFFEGRFMHVNFIWNIANTGFSKANNQALKMATGEYILFLNPDTILPEDCIEKSLSFFRHRLNAGAMGIRMIDGSGNFLKESKRAFPSPFTSFCRLSGLTTLFPRSKVFARYYLGHLGQYKNHEVDVLAGAFMLTTKIILDETGGFDERFFLYGEDVDLSYRIQKAGYKNLYFSESTIIHFKGESTKKGSLNYIRLFYGAMSLFVKKYYSGGFASFYNLLMRMAIWINAVASGISHWLNHFFDYGAKDIPANRSFILAGKKEFDSIRSILLKNSMQHEILGRIDPHNRIDTDALGSIKKLPALIAKHHATEIIFGIDSFSAKEMISLIQQLPAGMSFRIHFAGTFSIVGSKHKGSAGDCVAIDKLPNYSIRN